LLLFDTFGVLDRLATVLSKLSCLGLLPGERADLVAQNLALFRDFALLELLEEFTLPFTTAVPVHGVQKLSVRAHSANVDT